MSGVLRYSFPVNRELETAVTKWAAGHGLQISNDWNGSSTAFSANASRYLELTDSGVTLKVRLADHSVGVTRAIEPGLLIGDVTGDPTAVVASLALQLADQRAVNAVASTSLAAREASEASAREMVLATCPAIRTNKLGQPLNGKNKVMTWADAAARIAAGRCV